MDLGTQYHLTRYAFLFESIVLSDGSILVPPREEGLDTPEASLSPFLYIHLRTWAESLNRNYRQ